MKGDILKMITIKNYNVDLPSLSEKKLMYDFLKEMNFDVKRLGKKSTRDSALIKLLKSPSLMISASSFSNTMFLPSNLDELCDRLNLLLQEKQDGNNSDIINEENIARVDKLLEYKILSEKQHKQILIKSNLLKT